MIDENFDAQEFKLVLAKRSIRYKVWITTDGVLHCQTGLMLKSASVKFTAPTITAKGENGTTTSSGGDVSRRLTITRPGDGKPYSFSIKADKSQEKHSITLFITSNFGSTAEIVLINKKVPAQIEQ